MGSFTETERNKMLGALAANTAYQCPAVYVKLHTGDPGAIGTANPFAVTTRQQATFTTVAAGTTGPASNIEWTSLASGGTITYISGWSDVTAGTFLFSDDLNTAGTVQVGDTFRLPATTGLTLQIS